MLSLEEDEISEDDLFDMLFEYVQKGEDLLEELDETDAVNTRMMQTAIVRKFETFITKDTRQVTTKFKHYVQSNIERCSFGGISRVKVSSKKLHASDFLPP